MKATLIFTQLLFCVFFQAFSQPGQGLQSTTDLYQKGLNQYEAGHYNLARQSFEDYISNQQGANQGDAQYFRALCAIKLLHNDGEYLMQTFIKDFPVHSKAATARYTIGEYYFDNGNYTKAISNLKQATPTANISCDLYFMLGYSHFAKKQFEAATSSLSNITDTGCQHYLAANYYMGYVYYQAGDYDNALTRLQAASEDEGFGKSAALMIGNIYFQNEQYTEAVAFVRSLPPATLSKNPELLFIRGGAHFALDQHEDAVKYYEQGLEKTRNRASSDVFFNLAESYRKLGQNDEAISKYKLSALDNSEIGAYSSYYLGKLYVEVDNKPFARTAFQEALKSENAEIKEESLFQLARVLFDLGDYAESIRQLKKYNEDYPAGGYVTEANELMTDAFLNTSDYDLAINYIESLNSLSENLKKTYQEVTFLKGADLFNNRKFSSCVKYFDKSLQYRIVAARAIDAFFWKGEAYSIGKLYNDAIDAYKNALYVTPTTNEGNLLHVKARYGLGYAYYNEKDYPNAMANFITYLTNIPQGADERQFFEADARLRLADCYYVTKDYQNAEETYQRLLGAPDDSRKDYILFQLGLVNALQSRDSEAGTYFQQVIDDYPKSSYLDNAILQNAEIYFESGNYQPAIQGFSQLISDQEDSPLVPFALVKRALAYSNLGQGDKSEQDYKRVLNEYISHETANSALRGLQELATNQSIPDFNDYLQKYQQANPDDESLEIVQFEAAKSLYFNKQYIKAIERFEEFQQRYANSAQLSEANYYIADSYFRSGDGTAAIPYLKLVVADDQNNFQRRSLDRLGTLLTEAGEYQEAIRYFTELETKARNRRDRGNAWEGIMTVYWETRQYDDAETSAQKIIDAPKLSSDLKSKATLILAKVGIARKSYQDAEDYLIELVNGIKDETAAEANYELGKLYYLNEKYKTSLQTLFELNKNFAQYDQWLGKSFLLIADNYLAQEELFQAKATLNSIIENAEDDDLKRQAAEKLTQLEELEKEVVLPQDSTVVNDSTSNQNGNNE